MSSSRPCATGLAALLAASGLAAACSQDPPATRSRSSAAAASSAAAVPVAEHGRCARPGAVSCYCPDGAARGTQSCSADGTLSPCLCNVAASGGAGGGGVPSTPLCEELAGQSGCEAQSYVSQRLAASILFLVDRSKSMSCNPPPVQTPESCEAMAVPADPALPSRWDIAVAALKDTFAQLQAAGAAASVGLSFFSNDDTCGATSKPVVHVGPLTSSNVTTMSTILDATKPNGGTPLIGATILAYQYLHEEAGAQIECPGPSCPCAAPPCGAPGNRYVVLLTDGAALSSCSASAETLDQEISRLLDVEAPKAVRANVRTFVVGAPGSEPSRGLLSELAFQGGTASAGGQCLHDRTSATGDCHFDMTTTTDFAADLARVLSEISGAALSCEFAVPTALDGAAATNVNVQFTPGTGADPRCIARDDTARCDAGANGWQFGKRPDGTEDRTKVVLCGGACDMVESDPRARVDILVGCQSIVLE